MATTARRPQLQAFTLRGERFTAVVMTFGDLAVLDIEHLDLPEDHAGLQGLRGWDVYDGAGAHIGRVTSRACVMTAEWFDDHVQLDWLLAERGCRRLERGVAQIVRLRDDTLRPLRIESERRAEQERREAYAAHLQRNGLVLDEDGEEVYAPRDDHATPAPTFGAAFRN
ncbi:hypothetical protein [Streptomyces sp. NPDC058614]|uniref:hypothetical protein n=1 Tax=Streptomyces sp. NPDC058614 TaxID=3346557 RepID=UPI00364CE65B